MPPAQRGAIAISVATGLPLLGGCGGPQSALDPGGPHAALLAELWWVMLAGATLILLGVFALALYAMFRAPERRQPLRPRVLIVVGGLAFPTVTLIALLIYGTHVGRQLVAAPAEPPLRIEVIGHQWWWEIRYPQSSPVLHGANEIVVPVGRPVEVVLETADVIHSFWVPQLAGKTDLIPGKTNHLRFSADRPGRFHGQCAEFCGLLHAHMRLLVVALSPERFEEWQRQRARPLSEAAIAERGGAWSIFIDNGCGECHTIGGGRPGGHGPDLTFYGARTATGSADDARDSEQLAAWLHRRHPFELEQRFGEHVPVPTEAEAAELAAFVQALQ